MKLYRVERNPFSTRNRLEEENCTLLESLYYQLGYLYYLEEEKVFYLTKEDSIKIGYQKLKEKYGNDGSFYQLEYDIPISLLIKDLQKIEIPYETLIVEIKKEEFEKFPGTVKITKKVPKREIEKTLLSMLKETLLLAKEEKNQDYFWYQKYCKDYYESFSYFLNENRAQENVLRRSKFHITEKGFLFLTNYSTNHCILKSMEDDDMEEDEMLRRNLLRYTKKKVIRKEKILEYFMKIEK